MSAWPRWLASGLALATLEVALVTITDRDLFLSWTELGRYGLLATLGLPTVCLIVGALAAAAHGALGARVRWLVVALAWPIGGWALWALTEGRRARDLPGRWIGVAVLAAAAAWAAGALVEAVRRRPTGSARGHGGMALALAAGAALAVALDMHVLRRLYPAFHWSLAGVGIGLALLAGARLSARARTWTGTAVTLAAGAAAVATLHALAGAPNVRFAIEQCAPLSGKLFALIPAATAAAPPPESEPAVDQAAAALARGASLDLRGRDVLLISVDALRADRLRAYGGDGLTPEMDRLASESAVFLRAYTPTPHTSYALSSLMTGKLTREVLALDEAATDHPTLPRLLRDHGYRTAAFYPPAIFFVDAERFAWLREDHLGFEYVKAMYASAPQRVEQLEAYLEAAAPGRPLFLWVHLFEPHEPYEPDPRFARGDRPVERYDGEVASVDHAVGRLVRLFRTARPQGTVVLTADHGEEFGDHGGHHHGTTLFDEQIRVPLLWSSPGVVPARVLEAPVETIDLTTTLLSALGVPREARMRGDDLSGLLVGDAQVEGMFAYASIAESRMITDGAHKLICDEGGGQCRLFDLVADPGERRDASQSAPQVRAKLQQQLAAMVASIPRIEALAIGGGGWPQALARARLGDVTAASEVVPLLASERDPVRAAAARAVGELRIASARNVVARLCEQDPSSEVRAEAAVAALRLGEAAGVEHVRELLDADPELARRAALALADAGRSDGVGELLAAARDANLEESARLSAIEALGRVGGAAEATALAELLPEVRLRPHVARVLGRIGFDGVAARLLESLREERYPEARTAQVRALIALGQRGAALEQVRRFLGTDSGLPQGVGVLVAAGALGRDGGILRDQPRLRPGGWSCEPRGCAPGASAALAIRPLKGPAQLVVRLHVEGTSRALRISGQERWLNAGVHELATSLEAGAGAAIPLEADGGVWVEAFVVVAARDDVPPPPPEPWEQAISAER
ncbi:MAG: sulfatase [Myxococcales bacterium]|nr:sulfatase [Myxococcales bacterium]